ncbi:MAG: glycosyltransferase family 2 protein [Acidobacteriota bacterium]
MDKTQIVALPRVAVVIATFNRWPWVGEAVESVLAQTYPNVECVVVDDASTDGTSRRLSGEYRNRITLLTRPKNGEKSAARNDGIRATQAAFVAILDSDDLLTPDSVEARMRVFLDNPGFDGVVYGPVLEEPDSGRPGRLPDYYPEGEVLKEYVRRRFVRNPGYLLSTANMRRYGMYREDLTHREDVELFIRLACRLEFKCCRVPVARVRHIDRSARYDYTRYLRQGDRLVGCLRRDPFVLQRLGPTLADVEFNEAKELARARYRSGDNGGFRRSYLELWRRWPRRTLLEARFLRRFLVSLVAPGKVKRPLNTPE